MVLRGGGDPTGLASLSDEDVARGLLAIPVPVITGLGHARDRSLLDEIAWRAADTPSKAIGMVRTLFAEPARTAIRHWTSIHHNLDRLIRLEAGPDLERTYERLVQATGPMLQAELAGLEGLRSVVEFRRAGVIVEFRQLERDLDTCVQTLAWDAFGRPLSEAEHLGGLYQGLLQDAGSRMDGLDDLGPRNQDIESNLIALFRRQGTELVEMLTRAEERMRQALLFANADLAALHGTVQALDADALLARGFVLAVKADGAIVKSAAGAALLDEFSLLFADGELAVVPTKPKTASVH
jgi:exodeoxyribonuclease VII large subunit